MLKIAHIIPMMNYGGVEVAIQKSYKDLNKNFEYKVFTIKKTGFPYINQKSFVFLIYDIFISKWTPDLIITSLWWSHPLGLFFSLFGYRWYAFFHSSKSTHIFDYISTYISSKLSDRCLTDSSETEKYIKKISKNEIDVIPFVFKNKKSIVPIDKRKYDFIFVGRLIKEKRIDLLLNLAKKISNELSGLKFVFIFSGKKKSIKILKNNQAKFTIIYNIKNEKVIDYLRNSKFYIHLADREGMSMSTIESIQSGCIPVIRPVGEIKNYVNAKTSIIINDDSENSIENAVKNILKIIFNGKKLKEMQRLGLMNVSQLPSYIDSLESKIKCRLNI